MSDLKGALGEAVAAAFAAAGLPPELGRVTASDRPDLADFQSNGALAAAKRVGRNPRELAAQVAQALAGDPRLAAVEVAGPGFINLKVSDAALAACAEAIAADPRKGAAPPRARGGSSSTMAAPTWPSPCMWAICAPRSSGSPSSASTASAATRCWATPISATGATRWAC
jgi:hypothetical protein